MIDDGKNTIQKITRKKNKLVKEDITPDNIAYKNLTVPPGERMCPVCRATLTKYESLYASKTRTSSGEKILIHGCKYCFKEAKPDLNRAV